MREKKVSLQTGFQQKKHTIFTYLLVRIGYQSVQSVGRVTAILKRVLAYAHYTWYAGVHLVEL